MAADWTTFAQEAPALAGFVRDRLEAGGLGLLATLRRDGAPRISGLEILFHDDRLWLAMMPGSVKGRDLRRDGRFALHNATVDKDVTAGDVKVGGVAVEVGNGHGDRAPDVGQPAELFATELTDVAAVRVDGDHLVIDSWRPGQPVRRVERT